MTVAAISEWFSTIDADAWTAIATWLTALIAGGAAIAAFRQLREARHLRDEQTRATLLQIEESRRLRRDEAAPYVVAVGERSPAGEGFFDLVVRNFGKTAARDIRVIAEPPLQRYAFSSGAPEDVAFPTIPSLAPGQEFRMFWDSSIARGRHDAGHTRRHDLKVHFRDSDNVEAAPFYGALDWEILYPGSITVYGMHHAAKALRDISRDLSSVRDGRGIAVWSRDGDARAQRESEYYEQRQREQEQQTEIDE